MKPGLNGGPDITGYEVRYESREGATWSAAVDWPHTGTTTTTTITGLTADTEYRVDVSALNGETQSASGRSDAVRTNSETTTSAPVFSGTTATREVPENSAVGTDVGAVVTASDDDGDTLTYTLEETGDHESFDIVSTSGQIQTVTGVDYNHEATKNSYSVTVKASDATASATIDVTITVTDVDEQPDKPAKPTVTAVSGSATSLTATWVKPGLNGGPDITGYQVRYETRANANEDWDTAVDWPHTGTTTTTTITGLTADTEYGVGVRALNGETPSAYSTSDAVRTNSETTTTTCTLNTGDIWCGVVTVGTYSGGVGFLDASGALTDQQRGPDDHHRVGQLRGVHAPCLV